MQVILLKDVVHLGQKGDTKNVSNGYARNYLFPHKLATVAEASAVERIEKAKLQKMGHQRRIMRQYKQDAERMHTIILQFSMKASEKGTTFSSIHVKEIVATLARHKITIKPEWLEMEEAIKTVGEHAIPIHFPDDTISVVRVVVIAQE